MFLRYGQMHWPWPFLATHTAHPAQYLCTSLLWVGQKMIISLDRAFLLVISVIPMVPHVPLALSLHVHILVHTVSTLLFRSGQFQNNSPSSSISNCCPKVANQICKSISFGAFPWRRKFFAAWTCQSVACHSFTVLAIAWKLGIWNMVATSCMLWQFPCGSTKLPVIPISFSGISLSS